MSIRDELTALEERYAEETVEVEALLDRLPRGVDPWQAAPALSRALLDAAVRATKTEREIKLARGACSLVRPRL